VADGMCKHGHAFTPENTYVWPRTRHRSCRTCRSEIEARRRAHRHELGLKRKGPKPLLGVVRVLRRTLLDDDDKCWSWQGSVNRNGYAQIRVGSRYDGTSRDDGVHRVVYEHFNGAIPVGFDIDHLCRNRVCVNPNHLEAVSRRENLARARAGGVS
jgi:hypothetical protein